MPLRGRDRDVLLDGRAIREARDRMGLSLRKLTEDWDLSPQAAHHWETGAVRTTSIERAVELARRLRVSLEEITTSGDVSRRFPWDPPWTYWETDTLEIYRVMVWPWPSG
jgi:DNA-binding XRE family transcriptional regulator